MFSRHSGGAPVGDHRLIAFVIQPGGFQAISQWSPTGAPPDCRENRSHISEGCQRIVLASLRDACPSANVIRWYRYAQPPANC